MVLFQVLFEERAKLFRFVEKEWRERGTGVMKLLHNPAQGSVRVLMRRDQVRSKELLLIYYSYYPYTFIVFRR